jgi:hypothetical protein
MRLVHRNCFETQGSYNDAFMSFPSGHSSIISAAMLFCCLLFRKTFQVTSTFSEIGILSWIPLVVCCIAFIFFRPIILYIILSALATCVTLYHILFSFLFILALYLSIYIYIYIMSIYYN